MITNITINHIPVHVCNCVYLYSVRGQKCIASVNVQLNGSDEMTRNRLGIVPHLNFHCNARITRIRVRLLPDKNRNDYPYIQVWRPSSQDSTIYTKIAQVQVTESHITKLEYTEADIPLTGINRIVVESGDVIGYYHPLDAGYKVRSIQTTGYVLYEFKDDVSNVTSVDLNNANYHSALHQPLVNFTVGKYVALSVVHMSLLLCYYCYFRTFQIFIFFNK